MCKNNSVVSSLNMYVLLGRSIIYIKMCPSVPPTPYPQTEVKPLPSIGIL